MNRLVHLSWRLLEMKLAYYRPDLVCPKKINKIQASDTEYDTLELEYKSLCEKGGITPTATDMVGFDTERASCRIVMEKWGP